MLRKILIIFNILLIISSLSVIAENEKTYELWSQSPSITTGITADELTIQKAIAKNTFQVYPLPQVGENYYLGVCEGQMTDGGYKGNSNTSNLYYYVLLMTDDNFIIISKSKAYNEYYWNSGQNFADISDKINSSYYTSQGYEIPCYIINPKGKYTNSNMTEYTEFLIVTKNGQIYNYLETVDFNKTYPILYNGILYRGSDTYRSGNSAYYYYMPDGNTLAYNLNAYHLSNGTKSLGTYLRIPTSTATEANGYKFYKENFTGNVQLNSYYKIPDSGDLYITLSQSHLYNETAGRYYYYYKIDLYRCFNGIMQFVKSNVFSSLNSISLTVKTMDSLDSSYYVSSGFDVPKLLLGDKYIVFNDGTMGEISLESAIYTSYILGTYNGRLAVIRNKDGSNYIYTSPSYYQKINYLYFTKGVMTKSSDISLVVGKNTGQDGYYSSSSSFTAPTFTTQNLVSVNSWWTRKLTNVFPDGRYVTGHWQSVGNYVYEVWYDIFNRDGTLLSTGPTSYSAAFSSGFDLYPLVTYAINNTKFILMINDVNNDWMKEYYRYSVTKELTESGETMPSGGSLGNKNITPPVTTDTEPIVPTIDFGKDDLPLGYNIKNNVIGSQKLDGILREQINTIRLNDIVILKKSGNISGSQNTGTYLDDFETYNYEFGSVPVYFYTNGQNFNWYCTNPENLTVGTYNKFYIIGDKTIYFTVKIIDIPKNNGITRVEF